MAASSSGSRSHRADVSHGRPAVQAAGAEIPAPGSEATSAPPIQPLPALTLAAIGIVYGDIGTSPLYTMREAFGERGDLSLGEATVLGVFSLIFWSLLTVVTRK